MFREIKTGWVFIIITAVSLLSLILFYQEVVGVQPMASIKVAKFSLPEKKISIILGGDIMLARSVEQKILESGDYSLPFRKIYKEFEKADIAIANLESPFYDKGQATPNGSMVFRALPDTIEGLNLAGLDLVSLANNHFGNQGKAGERYTFDHLLDNNIKYCGGGDNFSKAHKETVFDIEKIKIGFLCYGYPEKLYVATNSSPGIANMDTNDMKADIERVKEAVDFIVVFMHAGAEYTYQPGSFQINFAHKAIDSGADLIVGHHPHVVQTSEKYKNGYIIYSLGNLVFDQMWSEETQQGAVAIVNLLEGKIENIEIKPVHIYDYNQPDWADSKETEKILGDMGLDAPLIDLTKK